jgi:hypothetical protein
MIVELSLLKIVIAKQQSIAFNTELKPQPDLSTDQQVYLPCSTN